MSLPTYITHYFEREYGPFLNVCDLDDNSIFDLFEKEKQKEAKTEFNRFSIGSDFVKWRRNADDLLIKAYEEKFGFVPVAGPYFAILGDPNHWQAWKRCAHLRGRLAIHPGNTLPSINSRNGRLHQEGQKRRNRESFKRLGLVSYEVVFSKQAQKDAKKLTRSDRKEQAPELIETLKEDPFRSPPRFGILTGNLDGCYSRRINIQHRLVYEVFEEQKTLHVLRMWSHYGE